MAQARAYLNKLASSQRIYLGMLAEARQKVKTYRFAAWHPEAVDVVHVTKDVDGPFTADGWKIMDSNLKDSGHFLQGEEWVLGHSGPQTNSTAGLEQELRSLYEKDYISRWRDVLGSASLAPYQNDADAAMKAKPMQRALMAAQNLIHHHKTEVVAVALIALAWIPQPDEHTHERVVPGEEVYARLSGALAPSWVWVKTASCLSH